MSYNVKIETRTVPLLTGVGAGAIDCERMEGETTPKTIAKTNTLIKTLDPAIVLHFLSRDRERGIRCGM